MPEKEQFSWLVAVQTKSARVAWTASGYKYGASCFTYVIS